MANSRVGARIIARWHFLFKTNSNKGIQNAAVLPVPVPIAIPVPASFVASRKFVLIHAELKRPFH